MPEGRHPEFSEALHFVQTMRAAYAGQKDLKPAGEKYLLRPAGYSDRDYDTYKHRAVCLPTVRRTAAGLLGRAFNEAPTILNPKNVDLDTLDTQGLPFARLLRWLVSEVILVGAAGLLVDFDGTGVRLARYKREHILDWHFDRGRLTYLALDQSHTVFDQGTREFVAEHLVYRLDGGAVVGEVFQNEGTAVADRWTLVSQTPISANGIPLNEIPFTFVGSPTAIDSLLAPVADLVLDYYDRSAQLNWILGKVASPQLVFEWDKETQADVAQEFLTKNVVDDSGEIHLGAGRILQMLGGRATYVEVSGAGIDKIKSELDEIKSQLIAAGARALADQTQSNVAAETVRIQNSGEASVLTETVQAVGGDVTAALNMVGWFFNPAVDFEVEFSTDFFPKTATIDDVIKVVTAWQSGAVPLESVHVVAGLAGVTTDDFETYSDKIEGYSGA